MNLKYKNICICVGHYKAKQGAVSKELNISEWSINQLLAYALYKECIERGLFAQVIYNLNLTRKLKYINTRHFDIAFDLHCNAFHGLTIGHEVLYWHKSVLGKLLAESISYNIEVNHDRGSKPVKSEAGSYFCKNIKPVAVVLESCFIDNPTDFSIVMSDINLLAKQIMNGIKSFEFAARFLSSRVNYQSNVS